MSIRTLFGNVNFNLDMCTNKYAYIPVEKEGYKDIDEGSQNNTNEIRGRSTNRMNIHIMSRNEEPDTCFLIFIVAIFITSKEHSPFQSFSKAK